MKKVRLGIIGLLIILMIGLSGCSDSNKTKRYLMSSDVISTAKNDTYALINTPIKKKQKVASSGLTELYFDKTTYSVAVKDNAAGSWWYSLSDKYSKKADRTPCVLSLEVMYEGQRYYLDSQLDAVAKGNVTSTKTKSGIIVTYTFNVEFSEKETGTYVVPVEYKLVDGNLSVSVDCSNIEDENNPSKSTVTNLNLLNFFGSSTSAESDDYILVPDNCGGIIYTEKAGKKFENISLKVYGDTQENKALLGAYGMKKGDGAFVAIIENGDAISTINATAASTSAKYNTVGVSFALTETETMEKSDNEQFVYVPSHSYDGKVSICYRFLSGSNADYAGMAIACREQLIRQGVLSSETVETSSDLPFVVSALGTATTEENGKLQALTTFEQLQDMLTLLKGKGFSNIYVKYKGALTGGLDQSSISDGISFNKLMGDWEDLAALKEFASAQKIKLFVDTNYLAAPYGTVKNGNLATGVTNRVITKLNSNIFGVKENKNFAAITEIENNMIELHKFIRENGLTEISVSDSSSLLYSDYSSLATRQDVKEELESENLSLSSSAEVMVTKGNFYTLKNVSVISSLPTSVSGTESKAYVSVPFVQLILHGTLEYSCAPMNYTSDYRKAILKSVEYGALGEMEWSYESISNNTGVAVQNEENSSSTISAETLSYSSWATEIYPYYAKSNKALNDLRSSRMTDHYKIKTGIYCTEYGDTSIYVNYTDKDYVVQGVTVPANDFMRIN